MVKLGKWCEGRWKHYRKLMNRVHKMMLGVTLAERLKEQNSIPSSKQLADTIQKNGSKQKQGYGMKNCLSLSTKASRSSRQRKGNIDLPIAKLFTKKCTPSSTKEVGRQSAMRLKYRELLGLSSLPYLTSQETELKEDNTRRIPKPPKGLKKGNNNHDVPGTRKGT